jgi:hypothetical protein
VTRASATAPDWVVATFTLTKPTANLSIRVDADVIRSGDGPTALGLGIADDLHTNPYVWALDMGGDIYATVNTYGDIGERNLEVSERPVTGTSAGASMGFGYGGFDFQPGDSFSILVFTAGGTLTAPTARLIADDEVLNGSIETGTGSRMVRIPGTTTAGAVVAIDRFSAGSVTRSTAPAQGIVGAMAVEGFGGSCEAGACVWRAKSPDGTRFDQVGFNAGVAYSGSTPIAGPAGTWTWSFAGGLAASPMLAAYAPIGDNWTRFAQPGSTLP